MPSSLQQLVRYIELTRLSFPTLTSLVHRCTNKVADLTGQADAPRGCSERLAFPIEIRKQPTVHPTSHIAAHDIAEPSKALQPVNPGDCYAGISPLTI
jgi:hypothetical protein